MGYDMWYVCLLGMVFTLLFFAKFLIDGARWGAAQGTALWRSLAAFTRTESVSELPAPEFFCFPCSHRNLNVTFDKISAGDCEFGSR